MRGRELDETQSPNDADLSSLWYALQSKAIREHRHIYVILDGLDEIPESDAQLRDAFLEGELLPWGFSSFRFLLAADIRRLPDRIKSAIECRTQNVPRLNLDECARYFHDLIPNRDDVEELRLLYDGNPELLASVERSLRNGKSLDELRIDAPNRRARLFEQEWRTVDQSSSDDLSLILAIVAHETARHTLTNLARFTKLTPESITTLLAPLRFIQVDSDSEEVTFISLSFREFAAQRLWQLKTHVMDLIIDDLSDEPDSDSAVARLPRYLVEAKRYDQLFRYLTPQRFVRMVEAHQSLLPASINADLGVHKASQLARDVELAQLAVQSSILRQLGRVSAARAEVRTQMALGHESKAFALVQGTILKEDRLQLLAIIARAQKQKDGAPSAQVEEEIRRIYDQIDRSQLGNRALEIASDLIHVQPEMAIHMVEEASETIHGDTSLAWAYAHLSLEALLAQNESEGTTGDEDLLKRLNAHIKDPRVRRLAYALTGVTRGQTAREALETLSGMDNARDRIMFLRNWTVINRERSDAIEVVEHALRYLVSASELSTSAAVYRDLAEPLPYIPEVDVARRLVGTFDSQRDLIERQGPSQDYVRLQLTLVRTQSRYDHNGAQSRLVEIYDYVERQENLPVKAECFAWLVASFDELRHTCRTASMPMVLSEAEEASFRADLDRLLDVLLAGTADQYQATVGVIRALASSDPSSVIQLAKRLNTRVRRDAALCEVVESLVMRPDVASLGPYLIQTIDSISEDAMRDMAMMTVLDHLAHVSDSPEAFDLKPFLAIVNQSTRVDDAHNRCRACCLALRALANYQRTSEAAESKATERTTSGDTGAHRDSYASLRSHLLDTVRSSWNAIDIGWLKVETAYQIAGWLVSVDRESAQAYADDAEQLRRSMALPVEGAGLTFMMSLSLVIRAFGGTPQQYNELQHDLRHLGRLIDTIPSIGERTGKWSEVALRCFATKRDELGKQLVREHVVPLLQALPDDDLQYRNLIIDAVAPALHAFEPVTAKHWIDQLPRPSRDRTYERVAQYVLTGFASPEPFDRHASPRNDLTYAQLKRLCELASEIEEDHSLGWLVHHIAQAIRAGQRIGHLGQPTRQQVREMQSQLRELVDRRLPQPANIKHDGYHILALADVMRLDPSTQPEKQWPLLIQQAQAIPNIADRAYVLTRLLECDPTSTVRSQLMEEAEATIQQIPSLCDRSDRYALLASTLLDGDLPNERQNKPDLRVAHAKRLLRLAMESTVQVRDESVHETQRHIVDLAYSIDQQFADSLATLTDDDPARLSHRMQALEVKSKIKSFTSPRSSGNDDLAHMIATRLVEDPRIAWSLLGSLRAGRIIPVHAEWLREVLDTAAALPLERAYPIIAWAIENAILRYEQTDKVHTYVLPLFHGLLAASDLALNLAGYAYGQNQRSVWAELGDEDTSLNEGLIRAGERSRAFSAVREWLAANAGQTLTLVDPFFGPDDLEWLQLVASVCPDCQVTVVTSKKRHHSIAESYSEAYAMSWRRLSDQSPPETDIVIIGTQKKGEPPIHDRWLLTEGAGLIVGTSLSSLGLTKDAKLTPVGEKATSEMQQRVDEYLSRRVRTHNGERLEIVRFSLS